MYTDRAVYKYLASTNTRRSKMIVVNCLSKFEINKP